MKINENWMNDVANKLSTKSIELKQLVLANRIHKELEFDSLEQVLTNHLFEANAAQIEADAKEMQRAIDEMYNGLDKQVQESWAEEQLVNGLDGLDTNMQGKRLVNLLNCAVSVSDDVLDNNPRWQQMKDAETFSDEDISDLMEMTIQLLDNNAGFLARQEFLVMEQSLEKLPQERVEAQMNSGPEYARAYAAAMYIINEKSNTPQDISPYQYGLLAANSVEGCRLLAQYHYGKLLLEELMPKLKALAKHMLVNAVALALRTTVAYLATSAVLGILVELAITNTTVLFVVSLGMAVMSFLGYSQEEAVADLTAVWNSMKSIVSKIIGFFRRENTSTSTVVDGDTINAFATNTNTNYVSV